MSEDLYKRFNLDYLVPASDAGTKTGMSNAEIQYNLYKLSQVFDEVSKAADAEANAEQKTKLKVIAALGQDRIHDLQNKFPVPPL